MATEITNSRARDLVETQHGYTQDTSGLTDQQLDRARDAVEDRIKSVLSQTAAVDEMVKILRSTDDFSLRGLIQDRILPSAHLALTDPDAFRAHPLVDFTADQMPIKPCLALAQLGPAELPNTIQDPESPPNLSWFAGPPVDDGRGHWPRNDEGDWLSHVVQVDLGAYTWQLGEDDPRLSDLLHIPDDGVLQIFHDRLNWGWADDEAAGSWLVRWVRQPDRLLPRPDELPDDAFGAATTMGVALVASIPSFVGYRGPHQKRYQRVAEHLEAHRRDDPNLFGGLADDDWTWTSAWENDFEPADGILHSSLGGFGYNEMIEDVEETLAAKLPLRSADQHVLLFDIAGVDALETWFGDQAHLQAWIRSSDLQARAFDRTWCILRND